MSEDDDFTFHSMFSDKVSINNNDGFVSPDGLCWVSVLSCLLLACSYVGSLYVWRSELPRDHPAVIKRRFTSVLIVSALSPVFVWAWKQYTGVRLVTYKARKSCPNWLASDSIFVLQPVVVAATWINPGPSLLALMGIRLEGVLAAATLPLVLTMALFLGPLAQLVLDSPWGLVDGIKLGFDPWFWALCISDMRWLRNQVVAPLTEELVFRACMLPMLVPCAGPTTAIFVCPLFFGVAHFHHAIELLRFRQMSMSWIFLSAVFQFSYTAVFGAYTAFIFIRTGHLVGPVLCHSFCNYMGFPAVNSALEHPQRLLIVSCYLLGVVLFLLLFFPATDPFFYGSAPICSLASGHQALCS